MDINLVLAGAPLAMVAMVKGRVCDANIDARVNIRSLLGSKPRPMGSNPVDEKALTKGSFYCFKMFGNYA